MRKPVRYFSNSMMQEKHSERGFTLAETSISLIIMMVVGLGAASLFAYATKSNSRANERELAMALAQKRMEWFRSIPFDITHRSTTYSYPSGGLGSTTGVTETVTDAGRSYVVTTKIEDVATVPAGKPDAGAPIVKRITVTVAPGQPGSLGSVTLTTERASMVPGTY